MATSNQKQQPTPIAIQPNTIPQAVPQQSQMPITKQQTQLPQGLANISDYLRANQGLGSNIGSNILNNVNNSLTTQQQALDQANAQGKAYAGQVQDVINQAGDVVKIINNAQIGANPDINEAATTVSNYMNYKAPSDQNPYQQTITNLSNAQQQSKTAELLLNKANVGKGIYTPGEKSLDTSIIKQDPYAQQKIQTAQANIGNELNSAQKAQQDYTTQMAGLSNALQQNQKQYTDYLNNAATYTQATAMGNAQKNAQNLANQVAQGVVSGTTPTGLNSTAAQILGQLAGKQLYLDPNTYKIDASSPNDKVSQAQQEIAQNLLNASGLNSITSTNGNGLYNAQDIAAMGQFAALGINNPTLTAITQAQAYNPSTVSSAFLNPLQNIVNYNQQTTTQLPEKQQAVISQAATNIGLNPTQFTNMSSDDISKQNATSFIPNSNLSANDFYNKNIPFASLPDDVRLNNYFTNTTNPLTGLPVTIKVQNSISTNFVGPNATKPTTRDVVLTPDIFNSIANGNLKIASNDQLSQDISNIANKANANKTAIYNATKQSNSLYDNIRSYLQGNQ